MNSCGENRDAVSDEEQGPAGEKKKTKKKKKKTAREAALVNRFGWRRNSIHKGIILRRLRKPNEMGVQSVDTSCDRKGGGRPRIMEGKGNRGFVRPKSFKCRVGERREESHTNSGIA